jgi:regulator of sigma E protease
LLSFLIFAAVLSTLVLVHEWGHFAVARAFGIAVERFSIGFGPVLARWRSKGTEFCLSLLPFGGYVKLAGEEEKDATGDPSEFHARPAWQRFLVIFAGPFLNAVLAFVIFAGIYVAGFPALASAVGKVLPGSPAEAAGLREGDRIVSIDGREITLWEELLAVLQTNGGETVTLGVERDGERLAVAVTPRVEPGVNLFGKPARVGRIGVGPSSETIVMRTDLFRGIWLGAKKVVELTGLVLVSLGMLATGALSLKESMTGPIGIYFLTGEAARIGLLTLLSFTASLSVSLWVLNLLPIPVLDGGHILFIAIESVVRRPLSHALKERSTQVGLYFLLALVGFVIWQDFVKYGILDKLRAIVSP